jgi:hypothetical protein
MKTTQKDILIKFFADVIQEKRFDIFDTFCLKGIYRILTLPIEAQKILFDALAIKDSTFD